MDSYQNVFVMRHGDRLDNFNRHWAATAARPWDPHVSQNGLVRAFQTGQRIRSQTGSPIHRVFVSPFFRCVHTASEVVGIEYGLYARMGGETVEECRERYVKVVKALADKYPTENLILITHGEGLETTFSTFFKDTTIDEKDYCAHVQLRRDVSSKDGDVKTGEYETASKVVAALSLSAPRDLPSIDKSKLVKVAIEYGLCEMMNSVAIWPEVSPKDENFDFNISDLEAMFPEGMVDHNVDPIYKEMPKWEETVEGCKERYVKVVKALADKYPTENLLLITHREGLETTFSTFFKDITVLEVEDCAYVQLRREVSSKDGDAETGEYEVAQSGIRFSHIPVTIPTPV
ncbi:hypothetical protein YC2023_102909 [Brassica napus]